MFYIRYIVKIYVYIDGNRKKKLFQQNYPVPVTETSDMAPAPCKEFLDIQASIECRFILKPVRDMTITYSQMQCTDKYSQDNSVIRPVWLNGCVFVYELSGCGFEFRCCHLNFRYSPCFEHGVPWHSGNYRVSVQSIIRKWHDNNIQSNATYR